MSRDMPRSRDTIFQSFGLEGIKSWHLKVSENGHAGPLRGGGKEV